MASAPGCQPFWSQLPRVWETFFSQLSCCHAWKTSLQSLTGEECKRGVGIDFGSDNPQICGKLAEVWEVTPFLKRFALYLTSYKRKPTECTIYAGSFLPFSPDGVRYHPPHASQALSVGIFFFLF